MLGKERNSDKIDEEFIDLAWTKMTSKLDAEMPVRKTTVADWKSRYGLLLLFLFIGFSAGIGTMLFIQKKDAKEIEVPSEVDKKVTAHSGFERENVSEANILLTNSDQALNPEILNIVEEKPQKIKSSANPSTDENVKLLNKTSRITSGPNPREVKIINKIHPVPFKQEQTEGKVVADRINDDLLNSGQKDNMAMLDLLESKAIPPLTTSDQSLDLEILLLPKGQKFSFGFYLGTQTRNFDGLHGLSSGVFASYHLDRNFSIRTGLGYNMIKGFQMKSDGVTDLATPSFLEPADPVNLQEYSTVFSLRDNYDLPIQSLQYIELPLALNYRKTEKLGIIMGVKFSYLLNAKTDNYFTDHLSSEESAIYDEALYNSLRKMDFATVLGFGFYPTSNIGLEIKYNHGLVDYTIDENWRVRQLNTNKTFELSLNYFLR